MGFPKLDDTGHDTFGGAIGVSYIFALNQQLVVEAAALEPIGIYQRRGVATRQSI